MKRGLNNLLNQLVKNEVENLKSTIEDLSKFLNSESESESVKYTKCHLMFCQYDGTIVVEKYIYINTNGHDMDDDYYYDIMTDKDKVKLEKIIELILIQEHRKDTSIVFGCLDLQNDSITISTLPSSITD